MERLATVSERKPVTIIESSVKYKRGKRKVKVLILNNTGHELDQQTVKELQNTVGSLHPGFSITGKKDVTDTFHISKVNAHRKK